ncbi:helix-turn-helix domain-containing protein, partial [Cardiobacterium hominis]
MDAYHHITPTERGRIMTLFEEGYSPAAIATMLKRHRCTIL